jgi:hypothetical protein
MNQMKHSKQTQRQKPRDHNLFCSNETKKRKERNIETRANLGKA